jgi:pilus assembly protein CpaB
MRTRDAGEAAQQDPANANSSAMSRQQGIGYTTVTLQVPVDDVARVALAQKIGGLRLILRNADDKGSDGPSLVQESDVFTDPAQGITSPGTGPARQVVEVITGGSATSTSVLVTPASQAAPGASVPALDPPGAASVSAEVAQPASASPPRQASVYEQANAIAQQLQKAVEPGNPQ